MLRVFFVLLLIFGAAGCGNQNETQSQSGSTASSRSQQPQGESRSMIPEKRDLAAGTADVFLSPYFDEAGSLTEISAAPGESTTLYIHADYKAPYHMSAAEFSFELPKGMQIVETEKFMDKALTIGEYNTDLAIGFGCQPPSKFYIMKFQCEFLENFAGGSITLAPGINERGVKFLGFVSCKPETEKIPATSGTVTITKK